jgi:hypothetical protein
MEKDPAIYVRHILEAIANIEADIAGYDFYAGIGKCKSPGASPSLAADRNSVSSVGCRVIEPSR